MKHIKLIIWIINSIFVLLILAGIIGIAVKPHWTWEEWLLVIAISCLILFNIVTFIKWIITYVQNSKEVITDFKNSKKTTKNEKIELKTPSVAGNNKIIEIKNIQTPPESTETPLNEEISSSLSIYKGEAETNLNSSSAAFNK